MTRMIIAVMLLFAPFAHAAGPAAIQLLGKGVQIYGCVAAVQGYAWHLKAPDAVLTDAAGAVAGHHFAGPTWQALDGSTIVGQLLIANPAPDGRSIPWLVLGAKAHGGYGRFAGVTYVVRSMTEGGNAPASGCDAAHAGQEARVAYQATYMFFSGLVSAGQPK